MSEDGAIGLLGRCLRDRTDEVWIEFERRFGERLVAGVQGALRRSGVRADRERVEDLKQEVYCRLLEDGARKLRSCRAQDRRQVESFLRRVAENVVFDRLRAAAAVKRGGDRYRHVAGADLESVAETAADAHPSPEELLLRRERWVLFLRHCRAALRRKRVRRDLLVARLALLEGWTSHEIAAALPGVTASGIDSLLYRLRRRLGARGLRIPRRGG